jgi:hypothetical protein
MLKAGHAGHPIRHFKAGKSASAQMWPVTLRSENVKEALARAGI